MLHGHYGAALIIAATLGGSTPLPWLFFVTQVQDLTISVLSSGLHVEVVRIPEVPPNAVYPVELVYMPYSHSLFSTICFSLLLAFLTPAKGRNRIAVACTVLSHWILDLISHIPDLDVCFPFAKCSKVGLGLWNYFLPSMIVECGIIVAGTVLYILATNPGKRRLVSSRIIPVAILMCILTIALPFSFPPLKFDWSDVVQTYIFYGIFTASALAIERARFPKDIEHDRED